METQKYRCRHCGETFEIAGKTQAQDSITCPRCGNEDPQEYNACNLEVGPPPWEYQCQECQTRFWITAPNGPDEAKSIRCPVCRSKNIKWLAASCAACGTGG